MSWTYSGNPGTNAVDAVRFLIGDTETQDQLLMDGEIQYLLAMYNNVPINAAIQACETIQSKFSRLADEQVGQVRINFSQKAKGYATMAQTLRARLSVTDTTPYAGGILKSDKLQQQLNTNRVKPDFTKNMMDNPDTSPFIVPTVGPNGGDEGSGD